MMPRVIKVSYLMSIWVVSGLLTLSNISHSQIVYQFNGPKGTHITNLANPPPVETAEKRAARKARAALLRKRLKEHLDANPSPRTVESEKGHSQPAEKRGSIIAKQSTASKQRKADREARERTKTSIRNFCKGKWGTNYRMLNYCREKQTTAAINVSRMVKSGQIEENILVHCAQKWVVKQPYPNHRMVEYCINKQTEAKRKWNN